jgi:hypothetical protein
MQELGRAEPETAHLGREGEPEQPGVRERLHRLLGEGAVVVDGRGVVARGVDDRREPVVEG